MTKSIVVTLASLAITAVACGRNAQPANDPSSEGTGISGSVGPAAAGDPTGSGVTNGGTMAVSGAPASEMTGGCKDTAAPLTAKDRATCVHGCQGFDDTVPPGSKCMSQKTSCINQCNTKFTGP